MAKAEGKVVATPDNRFSSMRPSGPPGGGDAGAPTLSPSSQSPITASDISGMRDQSSGMYTLKDLQAIHQAMRSDFRSGGEPEKPTTPKEWAKIGVMSPIMRVVPPSVPPILDGKESHSGRGHHQHGRKGRKEKSKQFSNYSVKRASALLHKSENAYRPGVKMHTSAVDEIRATTTSTCNKLSRDNFSVILKTILELKPANFAMVDAIIRALFEKAIDDAVFQDLYAELCANLATRVKWLQSFVRVYEVDEETAAQNAADWQEHQERREAEAKEARAQADTVRAIADAVEDTQDAAGAAADGSSPSAAAATAAAAAASGAGGDDDAREMSEEQAVTKIEALLSDTAGTPAEKAARSGLASQELEELAYHANRFAKLAELEHSVVKNAQLKAQKHRPKTELRPGFWFHLNGDGAEGSEDAPYGDYATEQEALEAAEKITSFRRLLLLQCQEEFEKEDIYKELDDEEKADAEDKAAAIAARGSLRYGKRMELARRAARRANLRKRLKRRMLSNVGFIGHLFNVGVANIRVIAACTQQLSSGEKVEGHPVPIPDPEAAEAFCKLICLVALKLKELTSTKDGVRVNIGEQLLNSYSNTINHWSQMRQLPSKVRFLCMDVLEAGRRGDWRLPDTHMHATRKNVGKKEFHKMEAASARAAELAAARSGRRGGGGGSYRSSRSTGRPKTTIQFGSSSRSDARSGWSSGHPGGRSKGGGPSGASGTGSRGGASGNGRSRGGGGGGSSGSTPSARSPSGSGKASAASSSASSATEVLEGDALRLRIKSIAEESMAGVADLGKELKSIQGSPDLSKAVGQHMTELVLAARHASDRKQLIDAFLAMVHDSTTDASGVLSGVMVVADEMAKRASDGPNLPVFIGELLAPLVAAKDVDAPQVVQACWCFGPSGLAWKTVCKALEGSSLTPEAMDAAGFTGVLPVGNSRQLAQQAKQLATALDGLVPPSMEQLKSVAAALESVKGDWPASVADATTALSSCSAFKARSPQGIGFARSVVSVTWAWALTESMYDPAKLVSAIQACKPLFTVLSGTCPSAQLLDASLTWIVGQVMTGDLSEGEVPIVSKAIVPAGLGSSADIASWKKLAKGRPSVFETVVASL